MNAGQIASIGPDANLFVINDDVRGTTRINYVRKYRRPESRTYVPKPDNTVLNIPLDMSHDGTGIGLRLMDLAVILAGAAQAMGQQRIAAQAMGLAGDAERLLPPDGPVEPTPEIIPDQQPEPEDTTDEDTTDPAEESSNPEGAPAAISIPTENLDLPDRVKEVLIRSGVDDVGHLINASAEEIDALPIKGLGPKRSLKVCKAIHAYMHDHDIRH